MKYDAIQYNSLESNRIKCNTIKCNKILNVSSKQCNAIQSNALENIESKTTSLLGVFPLVPLMRFVNFIRSIIQSIWVWDIKNRTVFLSCVCLLCNECVSSRSRFVMNLTGYYDFPVNWTGLDPPIFTMCTCMFISPPSSMKPSSYSEFTREHNCTTMVTG